jgi:hypothetical protein
MIEMTTQGEQDFPPISKRPATASLAVGLLGCVLIATVHPAQRAQGVEQVDQNQTANKRSTEPKDDRGIETAAGGAQENVPAQARGENKPVFLPIVWGTGPLAVDLKRAVNFEVRVLDSDGAPIKGASVMLGTITDGKGVTASLPMIGGSLSDALGAATVKIPAGTKKVGLTTTAPGFAKDRHDFNTQGSPEIKLKRGRVVTVRAVDADGMVLEDAFPILQNSRILGREFVKQADGTHQSPVVNLDRRWMQVVASVPNRPLLFSGLVDVSNERLAGADGVMELGLRPGVLLEGRLDDSVPRPVKNGFVELMIVQGNDYRIERGGLQWQDTVAIKPDGTFTFVSVPPGGHAQLFALGEGFQTTNPTEQEMRKYFAENNAGEDAVIAAALRRPDILPQLVRLDSEHVQVTLPCRETAGLDVRVIDPAGNPVAGATGSFNPNGYFLPGELFIPGTEHSTRAMVASGANGILALAGLVADSPASFIRRSFLQVESDDEGMIRFRNLPSRKDSYEIEADALVMAAHPTSLASDPQRFALVNLKDGEIARQTITMERDVPRAVRELTIVYLDGKPLADTQLTVTEVTTSDDDLSGDWQQWSVQRLGPVSEGKSDTNGRVLLSYPSVVDGQRVRSLRLHVQGHPEKDVAFRSYVTVPVKRDRRVIIVVPAKTSPAPGALRGATATYATWAATEDLSRQELTDQLLQEPSLVGLRRLLDRNGFDAAEPVALKPERNWMNPDQKSAVVRVQTDAGERTVALAGVRPKNATWTERPGGGFPPEAAFVFDGDGELVRMIGGGTSASGNEESITLANLGGTGDFFVRTSAFESHPPYEYYSRWYRIGGPAEPSLTVHHYANSNSWSGINGSSDPISEFGFLGYEFNGQDIDHKLPGVTPEGAVVPRRILWDGRRNTFVGPGTQQFDGRSLYRVVVSESREFQSMDATADTIVAAGGRRDFRNWHQWTVTIPRRGKFVARLVIRDSAGKTVEQLAKQSLAAGQHNFQLQIAPEGETESASKLVMMFDASGVQDKTEFTIERMEIDDRESVAGQRVYVASGSPLRLFDKQLADPGRSLLWVIEAHNGVSE